MSTLSIPLCFPRLVFVLALFGILLPSAGRADDIAVTTKIEAVTVFPTGAEITRAFAVELPEGDHVLKVLLPSDIQSNSLQVETARESSVTINSLDLRPEPVEPERLQQRNMALHGEIAALEAEISAHTEAIKNAALARDLIETLALRSLQPQGPDTTPPVPGPQDLILLLDTVDERLSEISKTVLDAERDIEISREKIAALKEQLAEPLNTDAPGVVASIYLTAATSTRAEFQLSYRLDSASWQPTYEARLSTGEGGQAAQMELVRNAAVRQATTEDWSDVTLTISTAQRTAQISSPALRSQSVAEFVRDVEADSAQEALEEDVATGILGGRAPDPEDIARRFQAAAEHAGFHVAFDIPGRVDIDKDGNQRSVRIGSTTTPAELSLSASPRIDLTAYLMASFVVAGDAPLLPGRLMLFSDGVFVGETLMPLTTPGELLRLGFGAADLVQIERRETGRKSGETGLVSTAFIEERSYLTRVTSRYAFKIPITVEDQTPVTDDERVRVELLPGSTRPDVEDAGGRSGVYSWIRDLEPDVAQEIEFGFRVTWPKGMSR